MNDLNCTGDDLAVDNLIDSAVARRAAETTAGTTAAAGATATATAAAGAIAEPPAVTGPSLDEALIVELSRLNEIDWATDEAGPRIAANVAAAAGQRAGQRARAQTRARYPRPRRPHWLAAGAVAAAAALVAGAVFLVSAPRTGGHPGAAVQPTAGTGHGSASPSARATTPASATAMRIVGPASALAAIGGVSNGSNFLSCVTRSICYIEAPLPGGQGDIARSLNGGATWTAGARLPLPKPPECPKGQNSCQVSISSSWEFHMNLSCLTAMRCYLPFGHRLLETSDGFAHIRLVSVAAVNANEQIQWVACPTSQHCVLAIYRADNSQAFLYTDDGGASWATATSPPLRVGNIIMDMRCDPAGACVVPVTGGDESQATVFALSSADGGRSWNMSPVHSVPQAQQQYMASCGDARNCLVGFNNGYLDWVHVTASGAIRFRAEPFPATWPQVNLAVSCPTGRDCFVEASDGAAMGDDTTTLETTHDGGRTWHSLGTPMAPAAPSDVASFLSCPVPAGCIGIANDPNSSQPIWLVLSNLRGPG